MEKNITQARAAGVTRRGAILVQTGGKTQEAKSLSEEEVTGALVRALKSGDKLACFTEGAGEHTLDDADRTGYGQLKTLVEGNNYKTQSINLLQKPEIPKDCTMVIVGGPSRDYLQPAVDALKNYVENGGKAIFMLDPPLKFAKQNIDENAALVGVLAAWGVTADKDLVLDTSGVGQLYGLGPEIALVSTYGTHPIVGVDEDAWHRDSRSPARSKSRTATRPRWRNCFESTDDAFATTNLASAEIKPSPTDKKGPFMLGAAGHLQHRQGRRRTIRGGRIVELGREHLPAPGRQSRPVLEHDELALGGRRPDFDSSQGARRPPPDHDAQPDGAGVLFERAGDSAADPGVRFERMVEAALTL